MLLKLEKVKQMAKLKYKVRFPCGYEISVEARSGVLGAVNMDFDEKNFLKCPLHGKDCPPKHEKQTFRKIK